MDELEHAIAERLLAAAAEPPPGLGGRVLAEARSRRRWRRAVLAAAALGTAGVMAGALVVASGAASPDAVAPPPGPGERLISRVLPDGARLRALALGPDGSVLGMAVTRAGEPRPGVWLAGPAARTPRRVGDVPAGALPYLWTMAEGSGGHLWPERQTIRCLPAAGGPATALGRGWSGRERFHADGGVIVWDAGDTLAVAAGCAGPVRDIPAKGTLEAFSYPYAFVRAGAVMRKIDVATGRAEELRLPSGEQPSGGFAAGPGILAWADGDTLTVWAGTRRRVLHRLPRAAGHDVRLTAGRGRVVCSATAQDGDTGQALVYDVATGRRTDLPGEALAAGDRLLYRDGDLYRLS
ncbi:hypothetical protein [Actinomadura macrotermitis]|uniref:WD40 repeat domain-containing protein n=1 Tax=Actinomadura macrotermitis TaxID=2585200 RepID=A0A7K0BU05_9ACTN|nr:hypothetical protein [Actinomadura macrotermitis]MQY04617.1 hypothetical protein [Actinomadura macrotermitis]